MKFVLYQKVSQFLIYSHWLYITNCSTRYVYETKENTSESLHVHKNADRQLNENRHK